MELIKNQTTIVDSTVKVIRSTREQISGQFQLLASKLSSLTNHVEKLSGSHAQQVILNLMDPLIISGDTLKKQLDVIRQNLPTHLILPFQSQGGICPKP